MLGLMRKHAGSWAIKILLGAIIVTFAITFGTSSFFPTADVAFKINGESITAQRVDEEMGAVNASLRENPNIDMNNITREMIREKAQRDIISRTLLLQAARHMGLNATGDEIRDDIRNTPYFQIDGVFNFDRYKQVLKSDVFRRTTPEAYELTVADNIILSKLGIIMASSVMVTPDEVDQFLNQSRVRAEAAYLFFQPQNYLNKVALTAEAMQAYYQENLADFKEPPRVKFDYLLFTGPHFADQAIATEQEIAQAYEMGIDRYTEPEMLLARFIYFPIPPNANPEARAELKAQAQAVLEKAQAGDFLALAKEYGKDPAGRDGSEMKLPRGLVPVEAEEKLFAATPGESLLLEFPAMLIVARVEGLQPARVVPLDEVRKPITEALNSRLAWLQAEKAANQAMVAVHQEKPLKDVAQEYKLGVQTSALVSEDDILPGLPPMAEVWQSLKELKPGQAGLPITFDQGIVLPVLVEFQEARQLDFAQVKDRVEAATRERLAARAANEDAQKALQELKELADPAQAILARAEARRTGRIYGFEEISGLPGALALQNAMFNTSLQKPLIDQLLPVLNGTVVAVLLSRTLPDEKEKNEQLTEAHAMLLNNKQNMIMDLFLRDLWAQAEMEGITARN